MNGKAFAPVKASVLDDDAVRLLAIPFGGPIPHPSFKAGVDLDSQTFSERTDIKPDWLTVRIVDWHHGQDSTMGRVPLGKAVDLGNREGKSNEPDEDGWWVTNWWRHGEKRLSLVRQLAERGAQLFGSSETAPGMGAIKALNGQVVPWQRDIPGEIVRWPYLRQTISTSPQNTYSVIRPLKATLDDLLVTGERPSAAFWSDIEDAMHSLSTDLRSPSLAGALGAKAGRVFSAANETDLREGLAALQAALDRFAAAVSRQPDYTPKEKP
jgi:hypothetical protein